MITIISCTLGQLPKNRIRIRAKSLRMSVQHVIKTQGEASIEGVVEGHVHSFGSPCDSPLSICFSTVQALGKLLIVNRGDWYCRKARMMIGRINCFNGAQSGKRRRSPGQTLIATIAASTTIPQVYL